jgi:hypothetical protein
MSPLEALAVDYVKAADKLSEATKLPGQATNHAENIEATKEIIRAESQVRTMLAAIRSHIHAAYADELEKAG